MADTEPRFVVDNLIVKGGITLLGAQTKRCKTWLSYDAAIAVATGQSFLELPCQQGTVLYIDLENSLKHVVAHRMKLLGVGRAVNADVPLIVAKPTAFELSSKKGIELLEELVKEHQPTLVIIDPLVATLGNADENSSSQMRAVQTNLRALVEKYNVALLITHHVRKLGSNYRSANSRITLEDMRGSGDLTAGMDTILAIQCKRRKYSLECLDTRHKQEFSEVLFDLKEVEGGMVIGNGTERQQATQEGPLQIAKSRLKEILNIEGAKRADILKDSVLATMSPQRVDEAFAELSDEGVAKRLKRGVWALKAA